LTASIAIFNRYEPEIQNSSHRKFYESRKTRYLNLVEQHKTESFVFNTSIVYDLENAKKILESGLLQDFRQVLEQISVFISGNKQLCNIYTHLQADLNEQIDNKLSGINVESTRITQIRQRLLDFIDKIQELNNETNRN
jgi:hypothetical protein